MSDLFDGPAPVGDGYRKPRPWFGCDTYSESWRAYCEAWTLYERHQRSGEQDWEWRLGAHFRSMKLRRGAEGVAAVEHNIGVVEQDMKGLIANRAEIPEMLR